MKVSRTELIALLSDGLKRQSNAAFFANPRNNLCPLTTEASTTFPSALTFTSTKTAPLTLRATAIGGYAGNTLFVGTGRSTQGASVQVEAITGFTRLTKQVSTTTNRIFFNLYPSRKQHNDCLQLRRAIGIQLKRKRLLEKHAIAPSAAR